MPTVQEETSVAVLDRLYRRYKALALSIGARLMLGRGPGDAGGAVDRLFVDCERTAALAGSELGEHFRACRDAVADLRHLVRESAGGEPPSAAALDVTRASHRRLRKLIWEVVECEYVPCSGHEEGRR